MKHFNLLNNFRWFATIILLITLSVGSVWGAAVNSEAPANGKAFIIALYYGGNYYALPHFTDASQPAGKQCTLDTNGKVTAITSSTVEDCLWTLVSSSTNWKITYQSGGNTYYLWKTGTTGNTYNIAAKTTDSDNVWSFTSGTANSKTAYSVVTTKSSATKHTVLNAKTNTSFRVYGTTATYAITLLKPAPVITCATSSLTGFTYAAGSGPSAAQSFSVSGSYLTADISVNAPSNFEVSTSSGSGYSSSVTLTQSSGSVSATTVYIRLKSGLSTGSYTGTSITMTSTGAANKTISLSGSVTAACSANPSVGNASLNGSVSLASIPLQASVSDDGGTGCTISGAGFVWQSGGSDPTISNNKTAGTYNDGDITGTITGSFSTGVTYKIKAYATNGHGDGLSSSSFTLIPRSVTFDLNGHGSSTPTTQYVNNGGLATDPSYSESVTGYTFGGWYKEAGCSNSWTFGSDAVSGENKTLYAKWTANEYTITLNQDLTPTSAGTTSITATYNSNSNLADAIDTPIKDGWTFAGYYTAKNGGGTQIIDASGNVIASAGGGSTYTDASKNWKYADDITLYAKWTCTVTWSVNNLTSVYDAQTLTYNGTSTKVASVPDGEDLDLENDYCGDKFVGWTTTNIGSTGLDKDDDASEIADLNLFTDVAGSPELKTVGNQTFYAVFADYDE